MASSYCSYCALYVRMGESAISRRKASGLSINPGPSRRALRRQSRPWRRRLTVISGSELHPDCFVSMAVRFELFRSPFGDQLPSTNVAALFAPSTGGLWIGYRFGGFSFLKNGRLTNF